MILHDRKHLKGFTLIEVLIVVVIIAALAAMILPRFISQVDRATAAEALQMIGAIRRASEQIYATTGSYHLGDIYSSPAGDENDGSWTSLGLKDFEKSKNYSANYSGGGDHYNAEVYNSSSFLQVDVTSGVATWACNGVFKLKANGNGCTI